MLRIILVSAAVLIYTVYDCVWCDIHIVNSSHTSEEGLCSSYSIIISVLSCFKVHSWSCLLAIGKIQCHRQFRTEDFTLGKYCGCIAECGNVWHVVMHSACRHDLFPTCRCRIQKKKQRQLTSFYLKRAEPLFSKIK